MTKQEEIRQGLREISTGIGGKSGNFKKFLSPDEVNKILSYLHSQRVRIEVNRESDTCELCEGTGLIGGTAINDCCPECNGTGKIFCYGYVAVEPLIKEEK